MSWIETSSGNRISRGATISGPDHILIAANCTINKGVVLRGDVEVLQDKPSGPTIQIGKYTYLEENCQVEPPLIHDAKHGPITIGAFCILGANSTIRLANIGNRVIIEEDCVVDNLSIIYDCCVIRKGTVIPPKMVIPPYSEVMGRGKNLKVSELNYSYKRLIETEAKERQLI